ncbi:bifunctional hydroxymethylpyrimidine kinase/phosphomethylpyrimidine kinase [Mucilaginibacter sp. cycad4]|uniref:bifunctional hydroxymethylpyrimidine kinase/phosphomethylpyrimidine kinase n=1 Tax=Mucilaginibacter sp. cycad4 TaxID=3342096 RepID=UPI002AAAD2C1|nr:bifunctional hydroxymethylpyrimidine kinase/phosphomethylpyrimidine kinase [Mucilaginibacter gossypii]WPV00757.1 bifunctional hydroxymethylpyrimidine kinase/phosphomethylpyrimidine kinase [Mucilaginibacter gossypii]
MKTPHVLAIGSFAVHGTASLKTFTTILGERILPVPSLMLNGLTNMILVKKLDVPFTELLQSSFELAVNRELELILYIGYLGNAQQVDVITEMINTYRPIIKTIIVDPVCGDHGRTYVPADIIARWPDLIKLADLVFPNLTEIKIHTGYEPDGTGADTFYIETFRKQYPDVQLVITSIKTGDNRIGIQYYKDDECYSHSHPVLSKNYGGTGDAFLATFILNHFYNALSFDAALKTAADQTYELIKNSINRHSNDLTLSTIKLL